MNAKLENGKKPSSSAVAKNLSAIAIGRYFGVSAINANSVLLELGWIKKGPKGWVTTELGESLGGTTSKVKNSDTTYVLWPGSVLRDRALVAKMPQEKAGMQEGRQDRAASGMTVTASDFIDRFIANTPDWRGKTFSNLRRIIHEADPEMVEEWKWMGAPVWSHAGIVCIGAILKDRVELSFVNGSTLPDPDRLFNAALNSKSGRSIEFHEGDKIDKPAIKALIQRAVDRNLAKAKPAKPCARNSAKAKSGDR